jgi:phage head maturation protease
MTDSLVHDRATAAMELVDENTLRGLVVPWMTPTRVMDGDGRPPYVEQFDPATFDRQLQAGATNKGIIRSVTLQDGHDGPALGYALTLEPVEVGLLGTFRVRSAHIDDVRQMYADGIDGLSVRFRELARGGSRTIDGVVTRLRAVMDHVALVAAPAYGIARVAGIREELTMQLLDDDEDRARRDELAEIDAYLAESRERTLRYRSQAVHTSR